MKKFFAMLGALFAFSLSVFAGNVSTRPISQEDGLISTVKPQAKIINGHKFIDLGLPSGLLWAETNVGASSATDDGDYFAWGETKPKTTYSWDTYKWGSNPSKYNDSDGKTILDAADDAATVNWGASCRMPDSSDFQELLAECERSWQGNGYIITGPNGNTIFLPASGSRYNGDEADFCADGNYWSRSLDSPDNEFALRLAFNDDQILGAPSDDRYIGFTIRPVAKNTTSYVQSNIILRTMVATSVTKNMFGASINVSLAINASLLSESPEIGVCFSAINPTPTYTDKHIRLGSSLGDYDFSLSDLDPGTTYYYRAYTKLGGEVFYGNVMFIMTLGKKPSSSAYTLINGHKFINLGLPSGLLWAETNVGASSATDDGDYFAWGETEPQTTYSWDTYKWGSEWGNLIKYNASDGKTTLDAVDDAATVNWGAGCRMPSPSEFEELYNKCDWVWRSKYSGTSGYLVTGPNGNSIFFPASGYRSNGDLNDHGSGDYWSCTLISNDTNFARAIGFGLDDSGSSHIVSPGTFSCRNCGFSVRPVAKNKVAHCPTFYAFESVNFLGDELSQVRCALRLSSSHGGAKPWRRSFQLRSCEKLAKLRRQSVNA